MQIMSPATEIGPAEREQIRLEFYRAQRAQRGLSSVAVRRDPDRGVWFLDVGVTEPVNVPSDYRGLAVRVKQAFGAFNAVARLDQIP